MRKDKKMSNQVILETRDYSQFKFLDTNRQIANSHVKKLAEAMREKPQTNKVRPILVNEKMQVIDGQHRLKACEMLSLPAYYVIGKGLTTKDAQHLNAIQKNWSPLDYAQSYATAGDENYQMYLAFRDRYRLSHSTTLTYLTQSITAGNIAEPFRAGYFKVKNAKKADKLCKQLIEVGAYIKDYRQSKFGQAYMLLAMHPAYDHKRFLNRAERYQTEFIVRYENLSDYIRSIEALYNKNTKLEYQIMLKLN